MPQPIVAAADDHALRARPLDQRAGRGVAVDRAAAPSPRAALGTTTRPTTPAGAMTAMSALHPSRVPLSMVSVRKSGVGAGADDLRRRRLELRAARAARAAARGRASRSASARCSCSCDLRRRQLALERLVLRPDAAQADVAVQHAADADDAARRPRAALRRTTPKVDRLEHRHAATCEFTCAEISRMCPSMTARNRYPARWRISSSGHSVGLRGADA